MYPNLSKLQKERFFIFDRMMKILQHGVAAHGDICVEFFYNNRTSYNSLSFKNSKDAFLFVSDILNDKLDYDFIEIYGDNIEFKNIYKKNCPFTNYLSKKILGAEFE